jgi:hypothetical protein
MAGARQSFARCHPALLQGATRRRACMRVFRPAPHPAPCPYATLPHGTNETGLPASTWNGCAKRTEPHEPMNCSRCSAALTKHAGSRASTNQGSRHRERGRHHNCSPCTADSSSERGFGNRGASRSPHSSIAACCVHIARPRLGFTARNLGRSRCFAAWLRCEQALVAGWSGQSTDVTSVARGTNTAPRTAAARLAHEPRPCTREPQMPCSRSDVLPVPYQ